MGMGSSVSWICRRGYDIGAYELQSHVGTKVCMAVRYHTSGMNSLAARGLNSLNEVSRLIR